MENIKDIKDSSKDSSCEIECPQNINNKCELSKLDEKDSLFIYTSRCSHRLFKLGYKKEK